MIPYDKFSSIPYGGDYNPEQWPEEIWAEASDFLTDELRENVEAFYGFVAQLG